MKFLKAPCMFAVLSLNMVACGGDDNNAGTLEVACNYASLKYCAIGSGTTSECTQSQGQVVAGCSTSGVVLDCVITDGTEKAKVYFYDQTTVDALKAINPDPCAAFAQQ